jgi:Carboxypeptidase regulatory-like domain/TonB dependent receptor-like, beta-barrel
MRTPIPMQREIPLALFLGLILCTIRARSQSKPCILEGRVLGPTGVPLVGAEVNLRHASAGESKRQRTSADGRYVFQVSQAGSYTLTARDGESTEQVQFLRIQPGFPVKKQDIRLFAALRRERRPRLEPAAPAGQHETNCLQPTTGSQTVVLRGSVRASLGTTPGIQGAAVSLWRSKGSWRQETSTDRRGQYQFTGLAPSADYLLTVRVKGFDAGAPVRIRTPSCGAFAADFSLNLSSSPETVTVRGTTEPVVRNAPEVSERLTGKTLEELPSNGRNLSRFALLDPHLRSTSGLGSDSIVGSRFTIDGNIYRYSGYQVDGMTNYEGVFANAPLQALPISGISEMKVITNQYGAQYGGTAAGIISMATREGTKDYHGEASLYGRPSGLQAAPPLSTLRMPDRLIDGAGALGGPIDKDTQFFGSYEAENQKRGSYIQSPAPAVYTGTDNNWYALGRVDHSFGSSESLTARFNASHTSSNNPNNAVGGFVQPSAGVTDRTQSAAGDLALNSQFGHGVNQLQFQYVNALPYVTTPSDPEVEIIRPSYSTEGGSTALILRTQTEDLKEQYAASLGAHDLRAGVEWIGLEAREFDDATYGTYTFPAGAPQPGEQPIQYSQTFGSGNLRYSDSQINGFVEDAWHVLPRLTLNFGARYDWQQLTGDRNNIAPRFGFADDILGTGKTIVRGGVGIFYQNLYLQMQRFADTEGVDSPLLTYTIPAGTPGFPNFPGSMTSPPADMERDLYLLPRHLLNPYSIQATLGLEQDLSPNWTLTVDGIGSHAVKQLMPENLNAPSPFPRTQPGQTRPAAVADATRLLSSYNGVPVRNLISVGNGNSSSYDALDVGISHRFSSRFQLGAHYVYSSALTYSMFAGEPTTGDPNEWSEQGSAEYGPADFWQRHRFVAYGVVRLPFEFQAASVITAASGLPVDPLTGVDNNGDTYLADRPVGFGRDSFRGPAQASVDLSVMKEIVLRREMRLQFRVDAFNVLNDSNFVTLNDIYGNAAAPVASFLAPIAGLANTDPGRQVQLGARFLF